MGLADGAAWEKEYPNSNTQGVVAGAFSKATSVNPKDLVGSTKVSISKFPPIGTIMGAMAMMDGAEKYGAYNWRDKEVIASIYVDAAIRHIQCWFEGQENASDSKVHHLGHAIACCAILLDAQSKGKLVDDRPYDPQDLDFLENMLNSLSDVIKAKKADKAASTLAPSNTGSMTLENPLKSNGPLVNLYVGQ